MELVITAPETYKAEWVSWPPPWVRSNREPSSLSVVRAHSVTKRGDGTSLVERNRGR
jgi:hypothetical protein